MGIRFSAASIRELPQIVNKQVGFRNFRMEAIATLKIPSILMVIFFIGIVVSAWIALDPIRQKQRKSKYFLVTLACFIGFVLVA